MGEAMAASAAEQAATIAATQAAVATTQAIEDLQTASTQMSSPNHSFSISLPHLPSVKKGNLIMFLPNYVIIQHNGHRYIFPRTNYAQYDTETAGATGLPNQ
jgi:uncharacterized FAD-dependent dehydrogenase